MANPIQSNDLANKDVFKNLTDGAKELIGLIDKLTAETKQFGAEAEKIAKGLDFSKTSDIAKLNKLLADLTKNTENVTAAQKQKKQTEDALSKEEKQRLALLEKLNQAQKAQGRESERLKVILTEQRKVNRELAKDQLNQNKTYRDQSRTLIRLRKEYKDLAVQNKENTSEAKKLLAQITFLDARLKKIDKTVGQNQRNVGNYSSAFKSLGSQLGGFIGIAGGVAGAIAAIGAGIRASISLFSEFGLAIAKVSAVSGATEEQLASLTNLAKDLGQSTQFTASQVAGLQLELSKLGFDPSQIEAATASVLNFAIATDSDLARSGEVVAATLNAFQLEASEAGRVADVAAKAFSSSALDIEKFATSISAVGPAANAVDVSLERTTAILGKIVDSGIDASTAGTALRNVFIDLADKGITFEDALNQINSSQDSLSAANELFGKRGAVVAQVIANNSDAINELDESLQNAEGSAASAAETIGDTLDGDLKKLQSAIEGAILDGEGFEGLFRRIVQFLTVNVPPIINFFGTLFDVIGQIGSIIGPVVSGLFEIGKGFTSLLIPQKKVVDQQAKFVRGLEKENNALQNVKRQLEDTNLSQEERNDLIEFVNREYQDYLPNLISEEDSYQDIAKAIDEASAALLKRQILIREEEEIAKALDEQVDLVRDLSAAQLSAQEEADRLRKEFLALGGDLDNLNETAGLYNENLKDSEGLAAIAAKNIQDLEDSYQTLSDGVENASQSQERFAQVNNTEVSQAAFNLKNALEELEDANNSLTAAQRANVSSNIRLEYDRLLEQFGLTRDEVDKLTDSTDKLTQAQKENTEQAEESNAVAEQRRLLAAEILEIERRLREDIEKILANEELTATQQQERITEARKRAADERREAELVSLQKTFEEVAELEGRETEDQIDRATKVEEILTDIATDGLKARVDAEKEAAEAAKKLAEERQQAQQELLDQFVQGVNVVNDLLNDLSQKRIEQIDNEIAALNRREDQVRQAYEQGSKFATQSITAIDEERRRLEEERKKQFRQEAARELFVAGANVLAETGDINEALRQLAILSAAIPAFVGEYHDGGYTGDGDEWQAAGIVHKGEHVITKEQTGKYGLRHLSADDFDRAVETGYFTQFANPEYLQYDQLRPTVSTTLDQSQVINRLERVEDAILLTIDKKPQHNQAWDEMRKEMVYEISTRTKVERKRRKGFRY